MTFPQFNEIKPNEIVNRVKDELDRGRKLIAKLTADPSPASWENLIEPLERFEVQFGNFWAPISHLWSVMNSPELSQAFQDALPLLSDYETEVGQNTALYNRYRELVQSDEFESMSSAQKKLLDDALKSFKLSGVGLPEEQRLAFKTCSSVLSTLHAKFEQNILNATNAWKKRIIDRDELRGLPENALNMFHAAAENEGFEGWLITLDIPFYLPVMTYAENRDLRHELYRAYSTRASELGDQPDKWDNSGLIREILKLRHEMSHILSYPNYAELSLATKMAETPELVLDFLEDLASHSLESARADMRELVSFIESSNSEITCEPWDIAYYSEKLKQSKFAFSSEELRPYFPLPEVLKGLFDIVGRLFGVTMREKEDVNVWHSDARFFDLLDESGCVQAGFYLDLYARKSKRGGAWMDTCQDRIDVPGKNQLPIAFIVCNFSPPVDGKPSLLTHEEVTTLFHEFGHGLHHMLTRVDYPSVSGINGVPWDAVELPSQFMENWCWQADALNLFAKHVDTGELIPAELLAKMKEARNFQAGMQMVRQLEFAFFDFILHLEYRPDHSDGYLSVLEQIRKKVAVVSYPEWNRFPNTFHHVFGGGYAAGYYSYKWAEVLSADAFSLFRERGIFDRETGYSFRTNILEKGGSAPAMDLFCAFRGRAPETRALLQDNGFISIKE